MYEEIRDISMVQQSYASPLLFRLHLYAWILFLLIGIWPFLLREGLARADCDQTIFQIASAVLLILAYAYVSLRLMAFVSDVSRNW